MAHRRRGADFSDLLESFTGQAAGSPTASPSVDCNTQPEHDVDAKKRRVYRKTPLDNFRKTFAEARGVATPSLPGTPNSTITFEFWEKYCQSPPCSPKSQEKKRRLALQRSTLTLDISKKLKEKFMQKCKEQLLSLNDTNPVESETFQSHQGRGGRQREIKPREIKSSSVDSAFKAPERSRPSKIRPRPPVPAIVLIPSTPKTLAGRLISQGPCREKQGTSPQRAKSPSRTPPSRTSPSKPTKKSPPLRR